MKNPAHFTTPKKHANINSSLKPPLASTRFFFLSLHKAYRLANAISLLYAVCLSKRASLIS
ncbi:hypothetical protein [Helicobacter sp. MIT 01-3238]|uniref:hypothetical protein n=1 Tax=Helicobacter sp. MIT 01-3238 TaxID=398627 RepID=UPI0011C0430D|nr:hypothetical protein [Helicobacter sp. MIT 01-3238]